MSRTAFLETLASVAGIVPNAIAEPFHRWHEDDLTAKLYETAMNNAHEEKMAIIAALERAEANGNLSPESRAAYHYLIASNNNVALNAGVNPLYLLNK